MDALLFLILENYQTWFVFALVTAGITVYATEKFPIETVSLALMAAMIMFFFLFPVRDAGGRDLLSAPDFFAAFSNSALITVMAMLVLGQAVVASGIANRAVDVFLHALGNRPYLAIAGMLALACAISAFINNTTVVVIFMPVLATLARRVGMSASRVMIPLTYAASLGGMTTLIGTSTNLLISGKLEEAGLPPLGFFEFLIPGVILCAAGMAYVVLILPRMLPDRASLVQDVVGEKDQKFIAEIKISHDSELAGKQAGPRNTVLDALEVMLVQRGEDAFLPPFGQEFAFMPGDVAVVLGTRATLTDIIQKHPHLLMPGAAANEIGGAPLGKRGSGLALTEVIVAPGSRMIGQSLEMLGLYHRFDAVVLGVQRGTRIVRSKMSALRLQSGDVLLVLAPQDSLFAMASSRDVILLESEMDGPSSPNASRVGVIFAFVIAAAALEIAPIAVAAFAGAALILLTGCLNVRQAMRAMDRQVFFVIAASYMMSLGLERTGGAEAIANLVPNIEEYSPLLVMAVMFLVISLFNEIMSNNAAGLIFTPIALSLASRMGADPTMFIWAVVFAGSASFATPIGYQTNLLVMGPGHYKFTDYMKAGAPLTLIVWAAYVLFCSVYFSVE